ISGMRLAASPCSIRSIRLERSLNMFRKHLGLVAIAVLVVAAFLCSAFAQQPAPGKIPNAVEPQLLPGGSGNGRYQITGLNANQGFVVVDTHTGQCWTKAPGLAWQNEGTPVKAKE